MRESSFRNGNNRTTVVIAFFVKYNGYYFDYELMTDSARYVRNIFVLCCFDNNSVFEHLENNNLLDNRCNKFLNFVDEYN